MKKLPVPDKVIRISTLIDTDTLELLHAYSSKTGVPMAEIYRRAVREYLKNKEGE